MGIKTYLITIFLAGAISLPLAAQTPDLSGTWLGTSNGARKWILEQKDGKMHIKEMDGDRVEANFTCTLDGQECKAKQDGHEETVMLYFNGPKLVEIRERGSDTIKQRLALSPDGKTLTVETVPLSSDQKGESESFRRQES